VAATEAHCTGYLLSPFAGDAPVGDEARTLRGMGHTSLLSVLWIPPQRRVQLDWNTPGTSIADTVPERVSQPFGVPAHPADLGQFRGSGARFEVSEGRFHGSGLGTRGRSRSGPGTAVIAGCPFQQDVWQNLS
jgi:hypothetical protein